MIGYIFLNIDSERDENRKNFHPNQRRKKGAYGDIAKYMVARTSINFKLK